jgi:hypothetical protein
MVCSPPHAPARRGGHSSTIIAHLLTAAAAAARVLRRRQAAIVRARAGPRQDGTIPPPTPTNHHCHPPTHLTRGRADCAQTRERRLWPLWTSTPPPQTGSRGGGEFAWVAFMLCPPTHPRGHFSTIGSGWLGGGGRAVNRLIPTRSSPGSGVVLDHGVGVVPPEASKGVVDVAVVGLSDSRPLSPSDRLQDLSLVLSSIKMILDSPLLSTGGPGRVDYELVLHIGVKRSDKAQVLKKDMSVVLLNLFDHIMTDKNQHPTRPGAQLLDLGNSHLTRRAQNRHLPAGKAGPVGYFRSLDDDSE